MSEKDSFDKRKLYDGNIPSYLFSSLRLSLLFEEKSRILSRPHQYCVVYIDVIAPRNRCVKDKALEMVNLQKYANLCWIYVLCGVVLSGSVYQLLKHEDPCPLCLLERLGMIGTAVAAFLNVRFGPRSEHYGLAILAAMGGGAVSLRQILLHICLDFPTFGSPVFGYDLYVWAFIVFTCSVLAAAILLIIHGFSHHKDLNLHWDHWGKSAFWLIALVCLVNLVTILKICGLSACAG